MSVATHKASGNYRFNTATGETWAANDDNPAWYWQKLTESESLPGGDCDVQARAYVENKQPSSVLLRLERKTGRVWYSEGLDWAALAEPGGAAPARPAAGFRLLMTGSSMGWSGIRFNPETGETWTCKNGNGAVQLQKITDSEPLPLGDYDLRAASFVANSQPANVAMRIERKTGQTWIADEQLAVWHTVAEPVAAATASPPRGFKLIVPATKTSWVLFRLNSQTGETCGIQNGPSGPMWQKVADANPPAAGNYEADSLSYERNKQGMSVLFRIERDTGQSWVLNGPTWEAVAEPTSTPALPASKLGYQLSLTSAGSLWGGFRINRDTGAAWTINTTDGKPAWQATLDKPAIPAGDYELQAVSYAGDSPAEIAFKIDRKTGWLWVSADLSRWQSVAEDSTFPKPPLPKAGFRLVTGASTVSWDAYRFNPESGQTWHPVYQGVAFIDQDLSEAAPIPSGDYDLQMTSTVENNVGKVGLIRLNRQTGASWHKVDAAWQPIADNPPAPAAKSQ